MDLRKLWLVACAGLALGAAAAAQTPVGTSFTYQGELRQSGSPVAGNVDLKFRLYSAATNGAPLGSEIAVNNVAAANGRFAVPLDFGSSAFGPDARWLEIDVRSPAGSGSFVTLSPRQRITAAPVARYASEAGSAATAANATTFGGQNSAFYTNAGNMASGTLPGARLAGTYGSALSFTNAGNAFSGVGTGLTGLNAANLASGTVADARLSANVALRDAANTFTASTNSFSGSLDVSGIGRVRADGGVGYALQVGGGNIPMGLTTEVGGDTPLLNLDMNFRGGISTSRKGAAVRLDARGGLPAIQFLTRPAGLINETMAMVITDAGNVGIGTGSPTSPLHVVSPIVDAVRLYGPGTAGTDSRLRFQDDLLNVSIHNDVDGGLKINTSANSRLALTGGRVGIGTTTPISPLHVSSGFLDAVRVQGPGPFQTGSRIRFQDDVFNVSMHNDIDGGLMLSAPSRIAMMVGNVGIGTTGPNSKLRVEGNISGQSIDALLKLFKIDHPQDPANKYLVHSCIESDQMVNLYRGNATVNAVGTATVILPDWFEALNEDFSYQLTAIGAPAPTLHVAQEIAGNSFMIGGGLPGMKVSWVVTGVRKDAYAAAHPLVVEQEKTGDERGRYLAPEEHGQPADRAMPGVERPQPSTPRAATGNPGSSER